MFILWPLSHITNLPFVIVQVLLHLRVNNKTCFFSNALSPNSTTDSINILQFSYECLNIRYSINFTFSEMQKLRILSAYYIIFHHDTSPYCHHRFPFSSNHVGFLLSYIPCFPSGSVRTYPYVASQGRAHTGSSCLVMLLFELLVWQCMSHLFHHSDQIPDKPCQGGELCSVHCGSDGEGIVEFMATEACS